MSSTLSRNASEAVADGGLSKGRFGRLGGRRFLARLAAGSGAADVDEQPRSEVAESRKS